MLSPEAAKLVDEALKNPTEQEYHLTCRIIVKRVSYEDFQSTGKSQKERDLVYLVPIENSEKSRFFSAWIPPKVVTDARELNEPGFSHEVVGIIGHPFKQPARFAVFHRNMRCDEPHLFLMNLGMSQIIIETKSLHGKEVQVLILPESYDGPDGSITDGAIHGELPFEQKRYD